MPRHRALGFFAFAACALVAVLVLIQRPTDSSSPRTEIELAQTLPPNHAQARPDGDGAIPVAARPAPKAGDQPMRGAESKVKDAAAEAPLGVVGFASRSIVTSEQSVAAVFIIKRMQMVRGRAQVRWFARSGGADAGIDFSDVSGTARFADGQKQVAIYVPLRNDLLKEEDERFKVCLRATPQVRLGGRSCAEATILDDDAVGPT